MNARNAAPASEIDRIRAEVILSRPGERRGIRIQIPESATMDRIPGDPPVREYYPEKPANLRGFGARGRFFILDSVETREDGSIVLRIRCGRGRWDTHRLAIRVSGDTEIRWRKA